MLKRVFNVGIRSTTALFLLAIITLYIASFTTLTWRITPSTATIAQNGIIWFCHADWPLFHYGVSAPDRGRAPIWWPADGKFYTRSVRTRSLEFPIWMPLLPAALAFVITWKPVARSMIARRRTRQGRCGNCGYDLHVASTNQCPECGESTVAKLPQP